MKSLVNCCSNRRAMKISVSLRLADTSERSRKMLPTYCWVMVEAPSATPPLDTLERVALRMAFRSTPSCS